MQSFTPTSLLATASPLTPTNPPAPSGRGMAAKNESSFSRQLEQSRQAHARESARPAPSPKPPAAAAGAPLADAGPRPTQPQAAIAKEPARNARAAPARERAAAAQADSTPTETKTEPVAEAEAAAYPPADGSAAGTIAPALATPLAAATLPTESTATEVSGLTAQVQTQTQSQAPPSAADGTAQALTLNAATGPAAPTEPVRLPAQAGERNTREPAAVAAPPEPGAWQQAQAAAVLAESTSRLHELPDARQAEPAAPSDRTLAPLGLAGSIVLTHPTVKAGEVASVNLATPATSAEFRAALGAQVSWFARAGVQQAELHLNPADMGPVSIQIVLDGLQAQVNFGADSALTRQLIESGMPELAGALRDAGLTLTGGGVSQHAGGQRQDSNGNGAPGGSTPQGHSSAGTDTSADVGADPQREQTRRSAVRSALGGIDLYA